MNSWQKELSHINQSRFCFIAFSHIWYSFCFPNINLSTFSCQQLQWVIFIFNAFCLIFLEFSAFLNRTTTVPGATASQDLTNMQIFVAKCKFLHNALTINWVMVRFYCFLQDEFTHNLASYLLSQTSFSQGS